MVVKFIRLDYDETLQAEMLVMECIYPLDYRAHEVEKRAMWFEVFMDELTQLPKAGFVHHDIKRPSDQKGFYFDNILLTNQGLRLIDVGISAIKEQVGEKIFAKYIEIEQKEVALFRDYFLNR